MRAVAAQAAKAAKAFFFCLFWLVNLLRMLLGRQQAGVQRARGAENRSASVQQTGDRPGHTLVVCAAG
jgi:hypothetical protein